MDFYTIRFCAVPDSPTILTFGNSYIDKPLFLLGVTKNVTYIFFYALLPKRKCIVRGLRFPLGLGRVHDRGPMYGFVACSTLHDSPTRYPAPWCRPGQDKVLVITWTKNVGAASHILCSDVGDCRFRSQGVISPFDEPY